MSNFDTLMKYSYQYDESVFLADKRWGILRSLYDRNFIGFPEAKKNYERIPKKIHQIWLGSPIPEQYKQWGETWKEMHPDWEYRLWTEKDLDELEIQNKAYYHAITNFGPKSDFLRYHILNQFGGLYVDTDFECIRPFHPLCFADFFVGIGYPSKPELYVGLIGSIPHHPILERCIAEINKGTSDIDVGRVLQTISSHFFTRNFFSVVGKNTPGVFALPPDYFYPFPNKKGHEKRNGRKYVKPISYAVHYWEISWSVQKKPIDWIQGEKFFKVTDMVYTPRVPAIDDYTTPNNTFDVCNLKPVTIVYTHVMYVRQLFEIIGCLEQKFIIITHNGDVNIDDTFEIPENVICWYAKDVDTENEKVYSIPLGIENDGRDKGLRKRAVMISAMKKSRNFVNLVYMNHLSKTNKEKRAFLYEKFKNTSWVTIERDVPFEQYISNLRNHKFVICPDGNAIDTHRLWETLYMGGIPIVLRGKNSKFYEDLPICFVGSWDELTEEFLNAEYDRISSGGYNLDKLTFEYWAKLIKETI